MGDVKDVGGTCVLKPEVTFRAEAPNTTAELESASCNCARWGTRAKRAVHSNAYKRSSESKARLANALSIRSISAVGRRWDVESGPTTPIITLARTMALQSALASRQQESKRRDKSFRGPLVSRCCGRPKGSACEGERRPLSLKIVTQRCACVGPCGGVAPPRLSA